MSVSVTVLYVELDVDSVLKEPSPDGDYAVVRYGVRSPFAGPHGDPFVWQIEIIRFEGGFWDSVCLSSDPVKILSEWPVAKAYLMDIPKEKKLEIFELAKKDGVRFLPAP